jgi:hypothetical protein
MVILPIGAITFTATIFYGVIIYKTIRTARRLSYLKRIYSSTGQISSRDVLDSEIVSPRTIRPTNLSPRRFPSPIRSPRTQTISRYLQRVHKDYITILRGPIMIVSVIIINNIVSFLFHVPLYQHNTKYQVSFQAWAKCAFSHYDGSDSWKAVCRDHSSDRIPFPLILSYFVFLASQALLLSLTYLFSPNTFAIFNRRVFYLLSGGMIILDGKPSSRGILYGLRQAIIHRSWSSIDVNAPLSDYMESTSSPKLYAAELIAPDNSMEEYGPEELASALGRIDQ